MFDRIQEGVTIALFCPVFIVICGRIALKFDAARIHDDFNCHCFYCYDDGA